METLSKLVGEANTGKSSLVQFCADLCGKELKLMTLSSATDVTDLLGAFEQYNRQRALSAKWKCLIDRVRIRLNEIQSGTSLFSIIKSLEKRDLKALANLSSDWSDEEKILANEIRSLESKVGDSDRGSFTWINSDLVTAVEHGHWIVLDSASLGEFSNNRSLVG